MRYKSRSRALAASALAASLGLAGLGLVAPAANAAPATTDRIAGQDRYETAADIADASYPAADTVVLTTGEKLPDALSANPIAGANDAPILLTLTDSIPASTQAALTGIDPTNIIIVGGTAAVSQAVEDELKADGYTVTREAGTDRFKTAAEVALEVGVAPDVDADGAGTQAAMPTVALANGLTGLPDAVAASPMLHKFAVPLLLTGPDTLNEDAAAAIDALGAEQVLILGGTAAISSAIEQGLQADGINAERLAGNDRWGTATAIADFELDFLGFDAATTYIASGFSLADALAGGPVASSTNSPIVLVSETSVPAPTSTWIEDNAADIDEIIALGGTAVINDSVLTEAAALADEGATTNQTFVVSPTGPQTAEAGTVQQFSFSGITPGSRVDIQLVDCSNVATDANGVTTFSGTNPGGANNVAQNDNAPTAAVTVVNGVASGTTDQVVVPSSGTVTFSVDTTGDAGTCYVAVVFNDADDDDRIDLGANGQPTEAFGNSGDVTVVAAEAADNFSNPGTVTYVDLASNLFSTANGTFYYDSNDEFILAGTPSNTALTMEQFEARLSVGDSVAGTYRSNPANQSSFTLTDAAPVAPASVTAQTPGDDGQTANAGKQGVQLNFPQSGTATTASYNVYRATAIQPTVIGQSPTCPTSPTAYSVVGTVADTATATEYWFLDTTAQPAPSATPTNPQYCYFVTAVDMTGDEGPASSNTGPVTASAATTASTMGFQANADSRYVDANTVEVDYNNTVNAATLATNGSDFIVTATTTGANPVSEDITVQSAAVVGNGTDATTGDVVRIITSEAIPAGTVVTVTSKVGTDGNTVCAGTTTTNCQPAGQTVQLQRDISGPTATSNNVVATDTTQVITFSEAIIPATLTCADITTNSTETCTGIVMSGGDTVATVTYSDALEAADVLTLAANSVTDLAGNSGPAAALNETV